MKANSLCVTKNSGLSTYYTEMRTDRSLDKDAPLSRPVQRTGRIMSRAILGGLHHYYGAMG